MLLKIVSDLLIICLIGEIFARTTNMNLMSKKIRYKDFLPKGRNDFTDNSNFLRIMYGISPRVMYGISPSNSEYGIYKNNFIREKYLVFGPYPRGIPQTIINSNTSHNFNSRTVSSALQQSYFKVYVVNYPESIYDNSEKEKLYLNNDHKTVHRSKRQINQIKHKIYNNEETPILPLRVVQNVHYSNMIASSNPDINQYVSKIGDYPIQNNQNKILTYRTVNDDDSEAIHLNVPVYDLRYFPKNLQVLQRNFGQPVSISNPPYNRKSYKSQQPRRHQDNGILSSGDLFSYPWHYNNHLGENNDGRNYLILRHKFEFPITVREPFQGNSLTYQNGKELLDKLRQDEAFEAYSQRAVTDFVRNSNYDYPYYDFTGLNPYKK